MLEAQKNESPSISLLEYLVIKLFDRGSIVVLFEGRRNSGKTNMALLLMEIAHDYKKVQLCASNEKILESDFPIEYIDNLQDLNSWARNQRGKKLFILDEAGKAMARRSPMNKLNIQLLQSFQTLRHSDLSLFIIVPHEKYIDSASLGTDVLDLRIRKTYSKNDGTPNQKIALWVDLLTKESFVLTDIEATRLRYEDKWDCEFKKDAPVNRPKFSDKQQEYLWEWCHGATPKSLGIDNMAMSRILHRFVKEVLERECSA